MKKKPPMYTMKEMVDLYREHCKQDNYWLFVGDFLDYFYQKKLTNEERVELIKDEPTFYEDVPNYQYSMMSAIAHNLSDMYELTPPAWCLSFKYVLDIPYYPVQTETDLKTYLTINSPIHFKARMCFVSDNILSRA